MDAVARPVPTNKSGNTELAKVQALLEFVKSRLDQD